MMVAELLTDAQTLGLLALGVGVQLVHAGFYLLDRARLHADLAEIRGALGLPAQRPRRRIAGASAEKSPPRIV